MSRNKYICVPLVKTSVVKLVKVIFMEESSSVIFSVKKNKKIVYFMRDNTKSEKRLHHVDIEDLEL